MTDAESGDVVVEWLTDVWDSTVAVVIGMHDWPEGTIRGRATRVEDPDAVLELRRLTTVGRFRGDIIRSAGSHVMQLMDGSDEVIGVALLQSGDRRLTADVDDPVERFARRGVRRVGRR